MDIINRISRFALDYKVFKKNLAYFGWTGFGNLGDEALYLAVKKLLEPVNLLKHPNLYGRGQPLQAFLENHLYSGVMLGAGTLINSREYLKILSALQRKSIKTFVLGTGVLDPEFYVDYPYYPDCMAEWVESLRKCKHVSVRGPLSQKILENYGYHDGIVCGDPALYFADERITRKVPNKIVGLNVGCTMNGDTLWGRSDEKVAKFLVNVGRSLIDRGYKAVLFPVSISDVSVSHQIASDIDANVEVRSFYDNLEAYLNHVRNLDFFIGEKLHSVILAMCVYTPSIMLSYTPKGEDFMESVGLGEYSMRTDALDMDKLYHLVEKIENDGPGYQDKLFAKINEYKYRLAQSATQIRRLI